MGHRVENQRPSCFLSPYLARPLPDIPPPLNQPGCTVFEVDPTTRTRLIPVSTTEYSLNTVLSAFLNSAPNDHTPEVLLTHVTRGDQPLMPEQGPDLIGDVVAMDDATFTTLPSLTSGASPTSQFRCRALLDTGSSQSFIHQGAFKQIDGRHRRGRRILHPINSTQIVEWVRLPRAAQHQPAGQTNRPVLPQQYAFRVPCWMDILRP